MVKYKILVKHKDGFFDAEAENIKKDILDSGIRGIDSVEVAQLYEISGNVSDKEISRICDKLLADPITQSLYVNSNPEKNNSSRIEVNYKSGVTDAVADTVKIGIADIGMKNKLSVRTGKRFFLKGNLTEEELKMIAEKILSNTVVQEYSIER
ncbi:MAG: phosphoribosylformylglycinamidine synthase subunit PurS [Elusimicrobia bacterium]|nr:phosphoribosylformylglycinamidine synthase subunit PurS [Elusimicrobiota bacterium]